VERYEKGCCTICMSMFNMSEGQGRASETWWDPTALGNINVEIG